MILYAKELIQLLLTKEGITQKELAGILSEKTGNNIAPSGLSRKMTQGTITYNDVVLIADILGYDIVAQRRENK